MAEIWSRLADEQDAAFRQELLQRQRIRAENDNLVDGGGTEAQDRG
jgi:hypothetical protein